MDDLPTSSAGCAGFILFMENGDCLDFDVFAAFCCHSRENSRPFRANGETIGGILHIAASEDLAIFSEYCGTYSKMRVGSISSACDFFRRSQELLALINREVWQFLSL